MPSKAFDRIGEAWPFKAIAAMSLNRVIGFENRIPWHLPADFKWFKKMTMGKIVLMGRKTFESLDRPLPNRPTFVLTHHPHAVAKTPPFAKIPTLRIGSNALRHARLFKQFSFNSFDQGTVLLISDLKWVNPYRIGKEVFICGGAQTYAAAFPKCSDLYLTLVKRVVPGDTFLPVFEDQFEAVDLLEENPDFLIIHYRNRQLLKSAQAPG